MLAGRRRCVCRFDGTDRYIDNLESLDDTQRGKRIGRHTYKVFCYAMMSCLLVNCAGLQRLIDTVN